MDENAVRQSLARVLSSPGFANAERLSRCLRYLVDETLAGRQDAIKEYTIGVQVYCRKPDYDPKIDAIVRVEASRLRAKLDQYYAGSGRGDAVRIELPRGGYVPVFHNGGSSFQPARPPVRAIRRPLVFAAALLTMAAVLGWTAFRLISGRSDQVLSLAVKPLANVSGDPETGRLAAALTQQLDNRLAAFDGFSVLSEPRGARAVLEGSVQRAGGHTRVLLRLVRARDGYQAWTATYDSLPVDESRFGDGACELAARTIRALFAGNAARLDGDLAVAGDAMNLYLKAREEWNTQRLPGIQQSASLYRQALAASPDFAKAYAGLAASELLLDSIEPAHTANHIELARQAAQRAIALDDRLADAHARLGNIYLYTDWDFASAEHELSRAVVLNPGRAEVARWYARAALLRRRAADARRELEFGALANSGSQEILAELGMLYYQTGDTATAWRMDRLALEAAPLYRPAHLLAGLLHEQAGNRDAAAREFSACSDSSYDGRVCHTAAAHLQALAGQTAEASRVAAGLSEFHLAALVYLGLGDRERALAALEKALSRREPELPFITLDPRLRPLHDDPRYQKIARQMGL